MEFTCGSRILARCGGEFIQAMCSDSMSGASATFSATRRKLAPAVRKRVCRSASPVKRCESASCSASKVVCRRAALASAGSHCSCSRPSEARSRFTASYSSCSAEVEGRPAGALEAGGANHIPMSAARTKAASRRVMLWSNVPLIEFIRAGWTAHENGTREQVRGTTVLFRSTGAEFQDFSGQVESSEPCNRPGPGLKYQEPHEDKHFGPLGLSRSLSRPGLPPLD